MGSLVLNLVDNFKIIFSSEGALLTTIKKKA